MRVSTIGRRMVCGCCIALCASSTGVGSAEPAPGAEVKVPRVLAAAVARDLGIEADQYLERAEMAQRLAAFQPRGRTAYRDVYAGIRMDGDRAIVALADGPGRDAARQAAEQAGFTVEQVEHSEEALWQRRDALVRWIGAQPADIARTMLGDGIDVARNTVVLHATEAPQLPPEIGEIEIVTVAAPQSGPAPESPDARPLVIAAPGADYIGGRAYALTTRNGSALCSLGFNATDAEGNTAFVTAAHCDPHQIDGEPNASETAKVYDYSDGAKGEELGYFTLTNHGPRDYALVRIHDAHAPRFQNNLVGSETRPLPGPHGVPAPEPQRPASGSDQGSADLLPAGSAGQPVRGEDSATPLAVAASDPIRIDGTASPVLGAPACKSGAMTGLTCGTVTAIGRDLDSTDGKKMGPRFEGHFQIDACGIRGDSGGSVITGTKALGITSTAAPASHCEPGNYVNAQPIDIMLKEVLGLKVRTS